MNELMEQTKHIAPMKQKHGHYEISANNQRELIFLPPELSKYVVLDFENYIPAIGRALRWTNRWMRFRSWLTSIPTRIKAKFTRRKTESSEHGEPLSHQFSSNLLNELRRVGECYRQFGLYGNHQLMISCEQRDVHKGYQDYVKAFKHVAEKTVWYDPTTQLEAMQGILYSFPGVLIDSLPAIRSILEVPDKDEKWIKKLAKQLDELPEFFENALADFYEEQKELADGDRVSRQIHGNWDPLKKVADVPGILDVFVPRSKVRSISIEEKSPKKPAKMLLGNLSKQILLT